MAENTNLNLSAPWLEYARMIYALFSRDPEITVIYDFDDIHLKLLVNNDVKADAISKLLPMEKAFGNITLKISVIPSNKEDSIVDIYRKAFNGNPIFSDVVDGSDLNHPGFAYVIFENKIAQYFNDQLNTVDGLKSSLYEDIAREVFEGSDGAFFTTQTGEDYILWP